MFNDSRVERQAAAGRSVAHAGRSDAPGYLPAWDGRAEAYHMSFLRLLVDLKGDKGTRSCV